MIDAVGIAEMVRQVDACRLYAPVLYLARPCQGYLA